MHFLYILYTYTTHALSTIDCYTIVYNVVFERACCEVRKLLASTQSIPYLPDNRCFILQRSARQQTARVHVPNLAVHLVPKAGGHVVGRGGRHLVCLLEERVAARGESPTRDPPGHLSFQEALGEVLREAPQELCRGFGDLGFLAVRGARRRRGPLTHRRRGGPFAGWIRRGGLATQQGDLLVVGVLLLVGAVPFFFSCPSHPPAPSCQPRR